MLRFDLDTADGTALAVMFGDAELCRFVYINHIDAADSAARHPHEEELSHARFSC